jgi:[ribosomal protein S18]-alanine N-acetyltransferase
MSKRSLRIRSFQAKDLEALCRIDQVCFSADIAFCREEFIDLLNHPACIAWVAEGPAGILGFVLARVENPSCAHVLTLDVVPEVRKQKIGTLLMNALHEDFRRRGIRASILEVSVRNDPARLLYEKLQYQYYETLRGYYHGREDAHRMVCAIFLCCTSPACETS